MKRLETRRRMVRDKFEHDGSCEVCAHRVTFRYWNIPEELANFMEDELCDELDNHAEDRAKECIIQGYESGELNCCYVHSNTDKEYEVGGWWQIDRS